MLVDKVEPEEPLHRSVRGIANAGEDVPGRSNDQENHCAREQAHLQQTTEISGKREKNNNDPDGKHYADQAFG